MGTVELSDSQRQTLTALVNKHQQSDGPVKGNSVAEVVDRSPGTIRNQMQGLKTLELVEGIPGPQGGYRPTENAFEALDREDLDERATVTLSRDHERIDATVDEIKLTNVYHPDECKAHVHFQQSARRVEVGDPVAIGPTPLSNLAIVGEVEAVNDTADEVLVAVSVMEAPLTDDRDR